MSGGGLRAALDHVEQAENQPMNSMHGEQLPLLPLSNSGAGAPQNAGADDTRRGVGRPPGSKNKNTEAWVKFLLSQYASPLEVMAATMTRKVRDLAIDLGYIVMRDGVQIRHATPDELRECLKIQLSCAKELAPYIHQKQPQAVDLGDGGMMTLNIFSAPAQDVQEADDFGLEVMDLNIEENQGVSGLDDEMTNDLETNGSSQGIEIKQENKE